MKGIYVHLDEFSRPRRASGVHARFLGLCEEYRFTLGATSTHLTDPRFLYRKSFVHRLLGSALYRT